MPYTSSQGAKQQRSALRLCRFPPLAFRAVRKRSNLCTAEQVTLCRVATNGNSKMLYFSQTVTPSLLTPSISVA